MQGSQHQPSSHNYRVGKIPTSAGAAVGLAQRLWPCKNLLAGYSAPAWISVSDASPMTLSARGPMAPYACVMAHSAIWTSWQRQQNAVCLTTSVLRPLGAAAF